jgi:hypothetical protein
MMRLRLGLFAALTLLAATAALSLYWHADAAAIRNAAPERPGVPVDLELVLGVDISYSMDPDEQTLQREGYIKAITSREFLQALRSGMHGKIAVTYFEWAGYSDQRVVVPWRLIEGPESADAFVSEIAAAANRRAARTSISGAIEFGSRLFEGSGYRGTRRVIDVSGDGANNNGQLVTVSRDEAVGKGITINGLPIMVKRLNYATMDIERLDIYYEDCVIGGPGAFVIPIENRDQFIDATRTKLVLEVAGRVPPARIIPVASDKPRVPCTIGERLWQERWGN